MLGNNSYNEIYMNDYCTCDLHFTKPLNNVKLGDYFSGWYEKSNNKSYVNITL